MASLNVNQIYEGHGVTLGLVWITGHTGGMRSILLSDKKNQPQDSSVGFLNFIYPYPVQIVGRHEMSYLDGLGLAERRDSLQQFFEKNNPACVIAADGVEINPDLRDTAERHYTPMFSTARPSHEIVEYLRDAFNQLLTDRIVLHGVYMDVLGMGVLISGDSGTGKSELALELVTRGHRLIADDCPEFTRIAPNIITGSAQSGMTPFLEVRGLGILNVQAMFGDSAVKSTKYLRLIVSLERVSYDQLRMMERLETEPRGRSVLGVDIPEICLPVAPGRNLAVLLECAVHNHNLKMQGYNATQDFFNRLQQVMQKESV
jgi:HPr kinase/phosphorylase